MIKFGTFKAMNTSRHGIPAELQVQDSGTSPSQGTNKLSNPTITPHKLNGENYLQWSQSFLMFIRGRGKEDYLTSLMTQPDANDPKFAAWKVENNQVMSWLINSMILEIGRGFLLYKTAKDIWEAVKDSYSSVSNIAVMFEIKGRLHELKQGTSTVAEYFNSLVVLWQQVDMYEVHKWSCATDLQYFQKFVENE